jgi:hypothetical protein
MEKHAAYTFLEISFGVNIVWSTFDSVKKLVASALNRRSTELCALVQVLESSDTTQATAKRVATLKSKVSGVAQLHRKIQGAFHRYARIFAFYFAISIPPILFFDQVEHVGNYCGLLILPLPVYFALSWLTFAVFYLHVMYVVRTYRKFISAFEGKPEAIKQQIDSAHQQ